MSIRHPTHLHKLMLKFKVMKWSVDSPYPRCPLCDRTVYSGFMYTCERCSYFVHKYCAEFPTEITHPFHPQHTLTLIDHATGAKSCYKFVCSQSSLAQLLKVDEDEEAKLSFARKSVSYCFACGGEGRYHQSVTVHPASSGCCEFNLDFMCASLTPAPEKFTMPGALAFKHEHQLIACTNLLSHFYYFCFRCRSTCADCIYVCLECKFSVDESCAALPDQMRHPLHDDHLLTLRVRVDYKSDIYCGICSGSYGSGKSRVFYGCSSCEFNVDIWCAKLEPEVDPGKLLKNPQCHLGHPLIQCLSQKDFPVTSCFACHGNLHGDEGSILACRQCAILLHASCIAPYPEIVSQFHPQHSLHFKSMPPSTSYWNDECHRCWCGHTKPEYCYVCHECNFKLHFRCAKKQPAILSSEIHPHPLALLPSYGLSVDCPYCEDPYIGDYKLRCSFRACNFNVHPHCLPSLPETFKHDCHIHPLTLSRTRIQELSDDDIDADTEFYCYACEEKRNLDHPCYYCTADENCVFIAHVHCLISQIVSCVNKSSEHVESGQKAAPSSVVIEELPPDSTAHAGLQDG